MYTSGPEEMRRNGQQVSVFSAHVRDTDSGVTCSLYPYAHWNADIDLPEDRGWVGCLSVSLVRYRFQLVEDTLQITATEFFSGEDWWELFEENGSLYERRVDGIWPFDGRRLICPLSAGVGFYDPVRIDTLECGLLLLSSEDPGFESEIRVYVPTMTGWKQAKWLLPDGTEADSLTGYARREIDQPSTGYLELCVKDQDGQYLLCHVDRSDGTLVLTPDPTVEVTADDLLSWAY